MTEQSLSGKPLSGGAQGFLMAFGAYILWGALPFYLKMLSHVPALEVVAHRIVWSVPVALILAVFLGQFKAIIKAAMQPKLLAMAALTATLARACVRSASLASGPQKQRPCATLARLAPILLRQQAPFAYCARYFFSSLIVDHVNSDPALLFLRLGWHIQR